MIATWYAIVGFMLIVYVVLDGRNFGAGMLHWLVAKTPEERRQVIAAIGPLWSWHEVWLVAFGGTLLAVFPKLLASAFAGYYLALFLILWCLILRGISLEVGGHINDRMWQGFWDFVFVLANTLLAILFGAAAGNMARGVPLASDGTFSMAFFTDFTPRGYVGLLDWYTVSIALFAAVVLAAHGATYLTLKTEGAVHDRRRTLRKGALGGGCAAAVGHLRRIRRGAPRSARARDSQSLLVARIAPDLCRGDRAGFRAGDAARDAGVHRVEPAACRPAGHRGGGHFSSRVAFDAGARKLAHRLRRRRRPQVAGVRRDLVADRFRAGGRVFRFHLATVCGKSQRQARQPRILLIESTPLLLRTAVMTTPTQAAVPATTPPQPATAAPAMAQLRRLLPRFLWLGGLIVLAGLAIFFAVPWWSYRQTHSITADAFVEAHIVNVAPQTVSGHIVHFLVEENDRVKEGDLLVQIDQEPYQVQVDIKRAAVLEAEKSLSAAVAQARGMAAQTRSSLFNLRHAMEEVNNQIANLGANVAKLNSRRATLELAQANLKRGEDVAKTPGLSAQKISTFVGKRSRLTRLRLRRPCKPCSRPASVSV